MKILGLAEQGMHEAAVETTKLCAKLFNEVGVNVSEFDVTLHTVSQVEIHLVARSLLFVNLLEDP